MLRHLVTTISLALAAQLAIAGDAGKVIYAVGATQMADQPVKEGAVVQEGAMFTTGADGFIYIKTIDNGLFILRPNTKARIAAYHVDAKNPANTRIKLELLSGVARSRSGEAVKLARQNFRFNTPVAAIGVRGTDFTVFTDQETSRVAVVSGAIVMTGLGGACHADGFGPCEGNAARELSATQRGQLLQLQKGQAAPTLVTGGAPDQIAPPRPDEPIGKNGGVNSSSTLVATEPNLDAKKGASLNQSQNQNPGSGTPGGGTPSDNTVPPESGTVTPPVDNTPPPVIVAKNERGIVWGRWQPVLDQAASFDPNAERANGATLVAVAGNFMLMRKPGDNYVSAERGSVGFSLKSGEAYIYSDDASKTTVAAKVDNGQLTVDFGKASFATSFDLTGAGSVYKMKADGVIGSDGRMYGNNQYTHPATTNMALDGLLGNDNGGSAVYIFQSRLDATHTSNGALSWGH